VTNEQQTTVSNYCLCRGRRCSAVELCWRSSWIFLLLPAPAVVSAPRQSSVRSVHNKSQPTLCISCTLQPTTSTNTVSVFTHFEPSPNPSTLPRWPGDEASHPPCSQKRDIALPKKKFSVKESHYLTSCAPRDITSCRTGQPLLQNGYYVI